jgi:hypothetical protein
MNDECPAVLNIAGVNYRCTGKENHGLAHNNTEARAIWMGADEWRRNNKEKV